MKVTYLRTERGDEWITGMNCERILEHRAQGVGDKWYYDIIGSGMEQADVVRVFDPMEVFFIKEEKEE